MKNTIDKAISSFSCEMYPETLSEVFKDYSLSEYLKRYIDVVNFGENIQKHQAQYIVLLYEGSVHMKLDYPATRTLLLYGLFRKNKDLFIKIHEEIQPHKQVKENVLELLLNIINVTEFKDTYDVVSIINDTNDMFLYTFDGNFKIIEEKILQQISKTYRNSDYENIKEYIFNKIVAIQWKSRWAKLKSFHRNYPQIVKDTRVKFLSYN